MTEACSVTTHPRSHIPGAYELGCKFKRAQCQVYVNLTGEQKDKNVKCCDTTLCNPSPYNRKINKTVIEHDFKCPEGIIRPTTKPPLPPPSTRSCCVQAVPAPTTMTTTTLQATTKTSNPIPTTNTMRSICPSHLTQRVPTQYIHVYGDKCYEFVPYAGSWMNRLS
ncbi:uncharacterized protein LOC132740566 [Ruditapes philippinarum]|uniref:uncharacterized protein LOC132740566 n=1 Tax=Ruditapes philippinarum TaxID=129788 RepID=UPI00295BAB39|nr:uncharacterized protein LOC132740566 [Ruditapes philippinarum]